MSIHISIYITNNFQTYTNDRQVPDSGATATAFLCGVKTNGYTLGVDDTVTFGNCSSQKGKEVDCILKWFNDEGIIYLLNAKTRWH